MKISKRSFIVYLMLQCVTLGFYQVIYSTQQHFSVDRLYPENWYTKARDYCMQVWGNFEDLLQHKKNSTACNYLIDASVGQLAFAKHCVRSIMNHKFAVSYDDLMHLSRIIGTIEDRYAKLSNTVVAEKLEFLHYVIMRLKHKMELLLQTNNTIASTSH